MDFGTIIASIPMNFLRNIRTFESLHLRDYRLLWLAQMTTSMGMWMDTLARGFLVYTLTDSPLQIGLVSAVRGAPMLIFGVVAGVAADRWGRKPQLIISQVVNAILNIILAWLVVTHNVQLWQIYVTGFLSGTVQAFQQPARQVLINDLVPPKYLMNAISLNSAAINTSRAIGPAIGGVLIQLTGVGNSYFVQAALYAFATLWTIQMKVPESSNNIIRENVRTGSFFGSTKDGFAYIAKNRIILALMILGLAPIVLGMPFTSLAPVFAMGVYHGGAELQSWFVSAVGVGGLIGGLVVASMGKTQGNGKLLIGGAAMFGVALMLFGLAPVLSPVFLIALPFALLAGFFNSSYSSQDQTIIQIITPANVRGRVLGVYLLNRGLMPVGSLLAGALANWIGAPYAVLVMGTSCLLVAVGVAVFSPAVWKLRVVGQEGQIVRGKPAPG
jgi:MFS family permease